MQYRIVDARDMVAPHTVDDAASANMLCHDVLGILVPVLIHRTGTACKGKQQVVRSLLHVVHCFLVLLISCHISVWIVSSRHISVPTLDWSDVLQTHSMRV